MENIQILQDETQQLSDENSSLKNKNIELLLENQNYLQRNIQLLADKEKLITENNQLKNQVSNLESNIKKLTDQNNNLQKKEIENQALLIINKKLLNDVEYYKTACYDLYITNTNNFVLGIYNNINQYIPNFILTSKLYKFFSNNHKLNMLLDLLKVFKLNPNSYILIIYKKFILPILLIPFFLSQYFFYRKIENIVINFLSIIFFIYYMNYMFDYKLLCIFI
jgi:seryl-tRNA synthetase